MIRFLVDLWHLLGTLWRRPCPFCHHRAYHDPEDGCLYEEPVYNDQTATYVGSLPCPCSVGVRLELQAPTRGVLKP